MNIKRVEEAIKVILEEIGENPEREGLVETPNRVARMYEEICSALHTPPPDLKVFTNEEEYDQMIIVKEIPFYSLCEHHLVTFFGKASVGYIPNGKYVGLSKIAKTVDYFARKPQVQERLTEEIADYLFDGLTPQGLIVVVKARHLCMEARGIKKSGAETVTSAIKGDIDKNEFLQLLDTMK